MKGEKKLEFYSLDRILSKHAQYNIVFGERSNGKTYSVLLYGLRNYVKTGKQMAIIRRYREDIRGKRADVLFDALVSNGTVSKLTDEKYTFVKHVSGKFYLAYMDETINKPVLDNNPFAYSFALTEMEHDKSTSYPNVTTILFDEFLSRRMYLPDEFVSFMNVVSTIIRYRDDVKIFMLGNTVNKYCPYFTEMGLKHVPNMEQGTIDVYSYGESKLKVAVEYAGNLNKDKPSNPYFAFDNPKLNMITGGMWEMAMYPHCPVKYRPNQIMLSYFIEFDGNLLQAEIVDTGDTTFTFIHRKTTPIKDTDTDIVYTLEYNPKPNYVRRLMKPTTEWQKKIAMYFVKEKVFYQDNEVGEIVRNYINTSNADVIK